MTSSTSTIGTEILKITEGQKRVIAKIIRVNVTKILCLQVNLSCFDTPTCNEIVDKFINGFSQTLAKQIAEFEAKQIDKKRKKSKSTGLSNENLEDQSAETSKKFVLEINEQIRQSCSTLNKAERRYLLINLDEYLKHAIVNQIKLLDVGAIYQNYIWHQLMENDMQVDLSNLLSTGDLVIPENLGISAVHDSFNTNLREFKKAIEILRPTHIESTAEHDAKTRNIFAKCAFVMLVLFAVFGMDNVIDKFSEYREVVSYVLPASLIVAVLTRLYLQLIAPSTIRQNNHAKAEEKEFVHQSLAAQHKANVGKLMKLEFFKIYINNSKHTLPLYKDNFKNFAKTLPELADELEEQSFIDLANLLPVQQQNVQSSIDQPQLSQSSIIVEANTHKQPYKKKEQSNSKLPTQQQKEEVNVTTADGIVLPASAIHYFSNGKYQHQCFYINKTSIKKELGERYVEYMQRVWKELTKYEKEDKEFISNKSLGKPGIKTSKPQDATLYPSPTLGTYAPMTMKVKGGNGERLGGFTTFFTKQDQSSKRDGASTTSTKKYALTILDYHMPANRAPGHK